MKKVFFIAILCAIVSMAMVSCSAQAPKANLKVEADSVAYALGISTTQGLDGYLAQKGVDSAYMKDFIQGLLEGMKFDKKATARRVGQEIGQQIKDQMLPGISREMYGNDSTKKVNQEEFMAGFIAGTLNKDMKMTRELANSYSQEKMNALKTASMEKQYSAHKAANVKFLEENKGKEGVVTTASGLQYKVITQGTGAKPLVTDQVKVHYVGTTIDGKEFDSSVKRGEPATFRVDQVIKGWTEALQLMPVGSKYQLFIPYELAYGAQGQPGSIDPFSTLVFEVELIDIVK